MTLVMSDLAQAGIIATSRGVLRILNREALEARVCKCNRTVASIDGARASVTLNL